MASLRLETTSADLTVHGDLQVLDVHSVSGDVEAWGVHTLRTSTTCGDVEVDRADGRVDVVSVSGDVTTRGTGQMRECVRTVSGMHRSR